MDTELHTTSASLQTPPDFRLLPGETIRTIIPHEKRVFPTIPSSHEQMARLTRANTPDNIGRFGPSVAALAFTDTPASPTPKHLQLYEVLFGRDSLRVAIDLISSYPELARTTTIALAKQQGLAYNVQREEEPGRIAHEVRNNNDPLAQELTRNLGWEWPYYGSIDATPEFIRTLAAFCKLTEENAAFLSASYTDRNGHEQTMLHALEMGLEWIERRLDSNPEGLLEYKAAFPTSIENQVWKDSWDAYHHADGALANHSQGIASIEVQVTTYDTLLDAAELFEDTLDQSARAEQLRSRAAKLKETILTTFWTEDKGGYFVLGTDRDDDGKLRQLKIRTSNMGHTLNSRLLEGDDPAIIRQREAVICHMLSPELLNASGIRTLARDEVRFRPGSYHNGSVWLWDTHHIAKGMRRHGYDLEADDLDQRLLSVIETTHVFPEYVRGDDSPIARLNTQTIIVHDAINHRDNKVEQPPQEVQAWTVAAILAIKKRISRRPVLAV